MLVTADDQIVCRRPYQDAHSRRVAVSPGARVIAMPTSRSAASEQHDLRATARAFFAKHSDEPAVRSVMMTTDGYDPDLWRLMADQLGLQALLIPSVYGGADFRFVDVQVVVEEMGRALVCAPYLSSAVLVVHALLASGDADRCAELLPGIADGTRIGALAFTDASGCWEATTGEVHAHHGRHGWTLSGRRRFVLDGALGDQIRGELAQNTGLAVRAAGGSTQARVGGDARSGDHVESDAAGNEAIAKVMLAMILRVLK